MGVLASALGLIFAIRAGLSERLLPRVRGVITADESPSKKSASCKVLSMLAGVVEISLMNGGGVIPTKRSNIAPIDSIGIAYLYNPGKQ